MQITITIDPTKALGKLLYLGRKTVKSVTTAATKQSGFIDRVKAAADEAERKAHQPQA